MTDNTRWKKIRDEAARSVEAVNERHFTEEALVLSIKGSAGLIYDLTETIERLERVAHAAWHLLDDGGEDADDAGLIHCMKLDADKLSDALDALEASGWDAHPGEGG